MFGKSTTNISFPVFPVRNLSLDIKKKKERARKRTRLLLKSESVKAILDSYCAWIYYEQTLLSGPFLVLHSECKQNSQLSEEQQVN